MLGLMFSSLFLSLGPLGPSAQANSTHSEMIFPWFDPLETPSQRHSTLRTVASRLFLNPAKLTVKINHCTNITTAKYISTGAEDRLPKV